MKDCTRFISGLTDCEKKTYDFYSTHLGRMCLDLINNFKKISCEEEITTNIQSPQSANTGYFLKEHYVVEMVRAILILGFLVSVKVWG